MVLWKRADVFQEELPLAVLCKGLTEQIEFILRYSLFLKFGFILQFFLLPVWHSAAMEIFNTQNRSKEYTNSITCAFLTSKCVCIS